MQETCQGPNEAVVTVDGVSISIKINTTIVRTMRTKDREYSADIEKTADIAHRHSTGNTQTKKKRTNLTCRYPKS